MGRISQVRSKSPSTSQFKFALHGCLAGELETRQNGLGFRGRQQRGPRPHDRTRGSSGRRARSHVSSSAGCRFNFDDIRPPAPAQPIGTRLVGPPGAREVFGLAPRSPRAGKLSFILPPGSPSPGDTAGWLRPSRPRVCQFIERRSLAELSGADAAARLYTGTRGGAQTLADLANGACHAASGWNK